MIAQRFPVASSEPPRFASTGQGSQANLPTTPKENPNHNQHGGAARGYVTKQRVVEIANRLSQRDHALIGEVNRLRLISGLQARRLLYEDSERGRRLARHDLARLTRWRVLARLERRVGGVRAGSEGYVYALDVLGQRIVEPGRRRYRSPWTPGAAFVSHALSVSELYVQLQERAGESGVRLMRFDAEPRCWRSFNGPGGRRLILKPDGFVVVVSEAYEGHYFIEIDQATESLPRITEKSELYGRYWQSGREQEAHGVYPQVLWIAPDERRRSQLVEALSALDPPYWRLFGTATSQQAADWITAGGSAP